MTPPRKVEVHPEVVRRLQEWDHIPTGVCEKVAAELETLEAAGPVPGHMDPVLGMRVHIVEERYDGMLWRFVFTLVEDGDTLAIASVVLGHPH